MKVMVTMTFDPARRAEIMEHVPAEQARVRELMAQGKIDALHIAQAPAIRNVDVHHASGNETTASIGAAPNASCALAAGSSHESAGKAMTNAAAAQQTMYRTLAMSPQAFHR